MSILRIVFQDWVANKGNVKGRLVLALFRFATVVRYAPKFLLVLGVFYLIFYRIFVEWFLGIELPWKLKLGSNARLFHGMGLVVNDQVKIGENVVLRHSTTIGVKYTSDFGCQSVPVIGNNVDIGSNVVILGSICVGDYAQIGAGSVVVKDVPARAVVVGNPAKIIKIIDPIE